MSGSATTIRSGELRHRVQFERNAGERVEGGSITPDWKPVGNPARCSISPLSGGKLLLAMQTAESVTHVIVMRFRGDVSPHWRIRWGARYFTIASVINVEERNKRLDLMVTEVR